MKISSKALCKSCVIKLMKEKIVVLGTAVLLSLMVLPLGEVAFAQYDLPKEQTGLDDYVKIAEERVKIAKENPNTGSGTPMFSAEGIVGAFVLSSGVFGGIAATFFVKSRNGKYAAIGRG